ncbi:MAG: KH domain-containing protein [Nanoarchaeota archaeon]|nr:KH domain-containing protein [Nanoarchaeota archaeon]
METLFFEKTSELKREIKKIEEALNVKLTLKGRKLEIEGEFFAEYEAIRILEAMQFGFSAKKALLLTEEDMIFRTVPIKHFTRRKDLSEVRGRIIGKEGKTKRTIEEISGCELYINEDINQVGIIGNAEGIEEATTALTNLIRGSKQANVYRFLERINAGRKTHKSDLGLKGKNEKEKN